MKKDGVTGRALSKAEEAEIVARLRAVNDKIEKDEQARISKIKSRPARKF